MDKNLLKTKDNWLGATQSYSKHYFHLICVPIAGTAILYYYYYIFMMNPLNIFQLFFSFDIIQKMLSPSPSLFNKKFHY